MKKNILALVALVMSTSLPAQTPPPPAPAEESTASWVVTAPFASQYMFRGVRLGGAVFQPSVEYDTGGLGLGVWTSFPLKDKVEGVSDPEIDFYGFYSMEVTKDIIVVPGFTVYTYPNAEPSNGSYKATFEPNIAFNFSVGGLKLTPKFYYDFTLKGPTAELNAAFAVPLKDLGTELDFTASIGTFIWKDYAPETSPAIKNWGDYYLIGVAAPFQVSKDSKVTIGWAYTAGSNNYIKQGTDGKVANSAALGRGVVTLSYTIDF